MVSKLAKFAYMGVAIVVGVVVYILVVTSLSTPNVAQARALTMPSNPHILYLTPDGVYPGLLTKEVIEKNGFSLQKTWASAQQAAQDRPLDALIIDPSFLENSSSGDQEWLQFQFKDGVVIVGLGANGDADALAKSLGLETLRNPAETLSPAKPDDYLLVYALALGHPDDLKILEDANWLDAQVRGENTPPGIKRPTSISFGKARGLSSPEADLNLLLIRLKQAIQGRYDQRAEFREQSSSSR